MAQKSPQIRSLRPPAPSSDGVSESSDTAAGPRLILALSGICAGVAALAAGDRGAWPPSAFVLVFAGLLALGVGVVLRDERFAKSRAASLLVLFPVLIGLAVVVSGARTPTAPASVLLALCWAGYFGVTLNQLGLRSTRWPSEAHQAADAPAIVQRGRGAQRALVTVALLGALTLYALAPALGSDASYQQSWGSAAGSARSLVAAVGGALALATLGVFVGPSLRLRRRSQRRTRRQRRARAAAYLVISLAFAGLALYLAQRP